MGKVSFRCCGTFTEERAMNKIKYYAQHSVQAHKSSNTRRKLQCFVPETSELFASTATISKKSTLSGKQFYLIQVGDITHYRAGRMDRDKANWIPHLRSFILGMLRGGLGFIKCQSYEAAVRYSNLGGYVALVRTGGAMAWGVVK